jgi:hypothetical protein
MVRPTESKSSISAREPAGTKWARCEGESRTRMYGVAADQLRVLYAVPSQQRLWYASMWLAL